MTPINFSPCRSCLFDHEGTLNISSKAEHWRVKPAGPHFPGVQVARRRSKTSTGVINGNSISGNEKLAPMVNTTQCSSTLVFENFSILNPLGTYFELDGHNPRIELPGLELSWSTPPATTPSRLDGFTITNTSDFRIRNTAIDPHVFLHKPSKRRPGIPRVESCMQYLPRRGMVRRRVARN
ncbi:hypothetical protein CC80DRAFT_236991 [Byssothecium circinans]|uniref:Pectin lyase-like protein n=1 Tax=Byssothecium circinans TaxID=147558 RepID=A0A6A5UAQ9_9PLEO|nr:hypothetical protein CC80DRAFT_236991 [Byssothecium circinans]